MSGNVSGLTTLIASVGGVCVLTFVFSEAMAATPFGGEVASRSERLESVEDALLGGFGEPTDGELRAMVGVSAAAAYYPRDPEKEALGKLLFHDKVLSGEENISCATCHHALAWTGDGLALSVGEGGKGLGVTRDTGTGLDAIPERVPRNAPQILNLGAIEFTRMFHDGRVEVDPTQPSGFRSPAGDDLPMGLDNVLAAQAMFPVTSTTEMAGQEFENTIANAAVAGDLAGPDGVWAQIADRLQMYYADEFIDAFDEIEFAEQITYVHAANAIAAFEAAAWCADNSPFDRWVAGERRVLSWEQKKGMFLFYGRAGCGDCHSGRFQTDQEFHAVAMPQIGPGKGNNAPGYADGHDDFGRENVTANPLDRCRFRTPSLRNVAATGPWGHDGAYDTLEGAVRHMLDPVASLNTYDGSQAVLPSRPDLDAIDFVVQDDPIRRGAIGALCELESVHLSEKQIGQLIAFLHALTDPASLDMRGDIPQSVPSGKPVFD